MTPEIKIIEHEVEEQEVGQQQPFVRQVQDRSRAADDVLTDQREESAPDETPALFVP
jgi:hypothetical protein